MNTSSLETKTAWDKLCTHGTAGLIILLEGNTNYLFIAQLSFPELFKGQSTCLDNVTLLSNNMGITVYTEWYH